MARSRSKTKGKKERGRFMAIPTQVLISEEYYMLNGWETKLLIDICAQYNGKNNGDLCAAWSVLKQRGWKSPATLSRALSKLLATRFLIKTRQGGRNLASLYAVSFRAIDECGDKIDIEPTIAPPNSWRN